MVSFLLQCQRIFQIQFAVLSSCSIQETSLLTSFYGCSHSLVLFGAHIRARSKRRSVSRIQMGLTKHDQITTQAEAPLNAEQPVPEQTPYQPNAQTCRCPIITFLMSKTGLQYRLFSPSAAHIDRWALTNSHIKWPTTVQFVLTSFCSFI